MRLVTFALGEGAPWRAGVRVDGRIVDLLAVHDQRPVADWAPTPAAIEQRGCEAIGAVAALIREARHLEGPWLDPGSIRVGPCVTAPQKIICIGLNYRRHAEEARMAIPEVPILFSKFANTLIGPDSTVVIPSVTGQADYEVELAVIIGRRAAGVAVDGAIDHVFGYATANDLSARDLQFRTSQWLLGKSLDGFLPIGPDLVTTEEVPDPQNLQLRTWRNGQLVQASSTADMIFRVDEIVAYASRFMTLVPGDVILTGTPEGVIAGQAEPSWLRDGDVVAVEIEGLGKGTTRFVEAASVPPG